MTFNICVPVGKLFVRNLRELPSAAKTAHRNNEGPSANITGMLLVPMLGRKK
ncbi:hypothetical protein [Microbulbifer sp. TRSA005]|uniref:hypothetical protein n=1 Tax=unclassified Microbulbifer TaxID=2619833 RepID=UPI00403917EE